MHYQGWAAKWDEWIDRSSGRLRFLGSDAKSGGERKKQAQSASRSALHDDVCAFCEAPHELVRCNGECRRSFHTACLPLDSRLSNEPSGQWRCADCASRRHRCFFCKKWAPREELRACLHRQGGKRCCGKMYHEACWVATLHRFPGALPEVSSRSSPGAGTPCRTQHTSDADERIIARAPPKSAACGDGLPVDASLRDPDAVGGSGGTLMPSCDDDSQPREGPPPSAGKRASASGLSNVHGSVSCALHLCASCGEAEGPGYGKSMQRCFRCCAAHHHKCMRITDGVARAALVLTHNTMVCSRCYHMTPMGLTAPDPRRPPADVPLIARHDSEETYALPPCWVELCEILPKLKALGLPLSGDHLKPQEFQLSDEILMQLRQQQVLPSSDFGPPPYVRLRRSVYLGQRREMLPSEDVAPCVCSVETGGCDHRCQNRAEQQECDVTTCPCGDACLNRQISTHNDGGGPPVELFLTEKKGWGVKAKRSIREGELVIEYVGEVISKNTWEVRRLSLVGLPHTLSLSSQPPFAHLPPCLARSTGVQGRPVTPRAHVLHGTQLQRDR